MEVIDDSLIVVLPRDDDGVFESFVSNKLREIVRRLDDLGEDVHGGLLGGSDGYGADFANDTFTMRPYWWGDCECGYDERETAWSTAHKHAEDCYQTALDKLRHPDGVEGRYVVPGDEGYRALCDRFGILWNGGEGCAVHCTCGHEAEWLDWSAANQHAPECRIVAPNFKCGDVEVRWYKYIGRGMEIEGDPQAVIDALNRALASLEPR